MLTIFGVVLVDMLGFGLIIPLLPFYATRFDASAVQVGLLFAVFSICQFVAAPTLGALSDRVGRRPVLLISQIGNAAGYALLAFTSEHQWGNLLVGLVMLYLARIIAGITSGNISAASAYIADITTPQNRTKGMGMLGAAFGFGFALGPFLGGKLAHWFDPGVPAWVAAGLACLSAIMCATLMKEAPRRASTSSANYLHPAQFAPLFANKPLMKINAMWFIAMTAFVAVDAMIVLFLMKTMDYTEGDVANYLLLVGAVILVTQGGIVGRLQKRYSEWALCIAGMILNGLGAVLTAGVAWYPSTVLLCSSAVIAAFGRSLFQPAISALASHHSGEGEQGMSLGFFQGVGTLGRIVGPSISGPMYVWHITWPWLFSGATLWLTGLWLGRLHWFEQRQKAGEAATSTADTSPR